MQAPNPSLSPVITTLAQAVATGDRRALARAITLVESARPDHRAQAEALLTHLAQTPPSAGRQALRIGLSGTPGVGKSTFIEALGLQLTVAGQRVAVLAVDPSSARSGGSILGDKTRMEHLARDPRAYIRPSPAQGALGGVARRSRDVVALCEAAGFDIILIETVGVGQSETMVAQMADVFVLLLAPAGGDELQGVKRGIMEMADIVLINKADGELLAQSNRTCADYAGALRLMRHRAQDPEGVPLAITVSAVTGAGIDAAWEQIANLAAWRRSTSHWDRTRSAQARYWFHEELRHALLAQLAGDATLQARLADLEQSVASGQMSPATAVTAALARPQS